MNLRLDTTKSEIQTSALILMKSCAYCGRENSDDANICQECGTDRFKGDRDANAPQQEFAPKLQFIALTAEDLRNDFATLLRCRTLFEADMIVTQLESIGIQAFIPDEFLMQAVAFNPNTFGYVRIQVPTSAYDVAKEFLSAENENPSVNSESL